MSSSIGPDRELLHYRIVDKVGEGGMGEVWRARDTTLDREVAIKILPDRVSADPERMARFEREAKLLASLNHPNIAAVYGLHETPSTDSGQAGVRFLVMELVAGQDLSQRLADGALPRETALTVARQIAEALEAAHETGVIHRDLKPANVRVTPDGKVKVLDFGLAKAFDPMSSGQTADPSLSPTITTAGTVAGMILGTAAYMSPEQAAGQNVDKRCDVWAFGVVLYEMLTGAQLFAGETVSHTLADVLRADLDFDRLPADTPPAIRRLVARCLERDPMRRLRDIGEARVAIRDVEAGRDEPAAPVATAGPPAERGGRLSWVVAALALLAAMSATAALLMRPAPEPPTTARFSISIPNSGNLRAGDGRSVAISRDGRSIVTRGRVSHDDTLHLRRIDEFESGPIRGTNGARLPFFSPDGNWLAFVTSRGFLKTNLNGGTPVTIGSAPSSPFGAVWSADGYVYFSASRSIWRLPEDGGEAERLIDPDQYEETGFRYPEVIEPGRALLFNTMVAGRGQEGRLMAFDLAKRELKNLGMPGTSPIWLPIGAVLFVQGDNVMMAGFDADELAFTGSAVPVLDRAWIESSLAQLAISNTGNAVFLPRRPGESQRLTFVDRNGKVAPAVASPVPFSGFNDPRLSPDGRRVALAATSGEIWIVDLSSGTSTMVSSEGFYPVWSPDGKQLIFATVRNKSFDLYRVPTDLSAPDELLLDEEHNLRAAAWAPDGSFLYRVEVPGKGMDLWIWPDLDDPDSRRPLMAGPDDELAPTVSPDGRLLAYLSDQAGRDEIYVTTYPEPGSRLQISVAGGTSPAWAPDGHTLYYMEGSRMVAVTLETEPVLRAVDRKTLFEGDYVQYRWMRQYDVHPDGERFLMIQNPERGDVEIITNWFTELGELLAQRR